MAALRCASSLPIASPWKGGGVASSAGGSGSGSGAARSSELSAIYRNYDGGLFSPVPVVSHSKSAKKEGTAKASKAVPELAQLPAIRSGEDSGSRKVNLQELILKSVSSAEKECSEQLEKLGSVSDEEVIHDLRVALRRLRSSFRVYDSFLDLPKGVSVKKISNLLRVMGNVRDADVMKETVLSLVPSTELSNSEAKVLSSLQKEMAKQRQRHLHVAVRQLRSKRTRNLLKDIHGWARIPSFTKEYISLVNSPALLTVPSLLFPHVSSLYLNPAWNTPAATDEPATKNVSERLIQDEAAAGEERNGRGFTSINEETNGLTAIQGNSPHYEIHELRKIMRELRYRMEMVHDVYAGKENFDQSLHRLKNLQRILGDLRDLQVAADYLFSQSVDFSTLSQSVYSRFNEIWADWLKEKNKLYEQEGREILYHAVSKPRLTSTLVLETPKEVKQEIRLETDKTKEEMEEEEEDEGEKENNPRQWNVSPPLDSIHPSHGKDLDNQLPSHADHIFSPAKFSDIVSSNCERDFPSMSFPSSSSFHAEPNSGDTLDKYELGEVKSKGGKKGKSSALDSSSVDGSHGKSARKN